MSIGIYELAVLFIVVGGLAIVPILAISLTVFLVMRARKDTEKPGKKMPT